jgi:tripartite-type tricarboxylate transporter receptor subunit TctC
MSTSILPGNIHLDIAIFLRAAMRILASFVARSDPSPVLRLVAGAILGAAVALGLTGTALAQGAQTYPSKSIRIIVAAAPGGSSDILARTIGQKLTEKWNQPVIVENKPGADSNVGAEIAAKSPPDGYTLILLDVSTLTMGPSLYPKLNYDPGKDFAPITMVVFSPHALVINPSLPVSSVKELIAYDKANPGKLNFASASNAIRLAEAQLSKATGIQFLHVPYKGGAAALTALQGGETNITLNGLLATLPVIKGGKLKALGVASAKRMEAAPEIPTLIESGVPDFVTGSWQGLLAPAGTPPDIIAKLNSTVVEILNTPETKGKLVGQGADVVANKPEEFAKFLRDDTAKWTKLVKETGIKAEAQ